MSKVILQDVRCSYVFITEPRKGQDGSDGKYSMQILIPKKDPQLKKVEKAVDEALTAKFGKDALKKRGRYKLPLRDGDEERDGAEYEGMMFMNANSTKRPGIVNRSNEPADQDDLEDYCYSGAIFHVSVNLYGFDVGSKPGIAVGLNNVMLRRKGERLDGTSTATSEFADFTSDDDGEDWED